MKRMDDKSYEVAWEDGVIHFNNSQTESTKNVVSMTFVGDIAPVRSFKNNMDDCKIEDLFGDAIEIFQNSDFSIFNLESVLSDKGKAINKGGPNLRGSPKAVNSIKKAGFDLACLANNHIMDFGEEAVIDTLDILKESDINYVGIASNRTKELSNHIVTIKSIKFGIVNCAETEDIRIANEDFGPFDITSTLIEKSITDLRNKVDHIIVIIHGGREYVPIPSNHMINHFKRFREKGANLIVGHHPHVPQGFEVAKGYLSSYSLGNFIFHTKEKIVKKYPYSNKGFILRATFSKKSIIKAEFIPYNIVNGKGIELMNKKEKENFNIYLQEITKILNDPLRRSKFWDSYVKEQKNTRYFTNFIAMYLNSVSQDNFFSKLKNLLKFIIIYILKWRSHKKNCVSSLNYLKNPTHYELLMDGIKTSMKNYESE